MRITTKGNYDIRIHANRTHLYFSPQQFRVEIIYRDFLNLIVYNRSEANFKINRYSFVEMEDIQRLMLQYVAAMDHQ